MIDFHCHIDLYPEPQKVIERVIREGMYVLAVTTTPRAWQGTNELVRTSRRIRVALGLHPELVSERHGEIELLCRLIPQARYIGEIGLDGSPQHRDHLALQQRVLEQILQACAKHGGRIMSVHSRGAVTALLNVLEAHPAAGTPVLHWFSGTIKELDRAVRAGCWFSVGSTMLRSQKGKILLERMPPDRVLTETDGPFIRKGAAPCMPWDVAETVQFLAHIWDESLEDASNAIRRNFRNLLTTDGL